MIYRTRGVCVNDSICSDKFISNAFAYLSRSLSGDEQVSLSTMHGANSQQLLVDQ